MISLKQCNNFSKMNIVFMNVYSNFSKLGVHNLFLGNNVISSSRIIHRGICKHSTYYDNNKINFDKNESFQYKLFKLHEKVEKKDVNMRQLKSVVQELKDNKYNLSQKFGVLLLKCCGAIMYDADLKTRQRLCEQIWNLLKKQNILTIEHYNALLQTYIDNAYSVNPAEFLQEMTVTPNYDTYSHLLKLLSITDTTASMIDFISLMEKNGFILREDNYNALIHSHSIAGNLKGIEEVINSMQAANIEPSPKTHMPIIFALAKNSDVKNMVQAIATMAVPLSDIMKLVKFLSLQKDGEHISDVFKCMQPVDQQVNDVINTIIELVHNERYSDACKIVTDIPIIEENVKGIRKHLAFYFLNEIINTNTDHNVVLEFIVNLVVKHKIQDVWKKAIQISIQANNETLTLSIFETMKAHGIVLQAHYYWPLLLNVCRNGEESDIYSIIKHLMGLNVKLDFITVMDYVIPYIDVGNPVATIEKMAINGIAPSYSVPPLMKFLLDSYRIQESFHLCKKFKKKIDCQLMLDSLILNYKKSKDIDSCIKFLFELSYNGSGFAGTFLKKFVDQLEFGLNDINNVIKFLNHMTKVQAVISVNDIKHIEEKISTLKLSDYDLERISSLLIDVTANKDRDNYNSGDFVHPNNMNIDQLKSHLVVLKTKDMNTRGIIRRLLMAACKDNDVKLVNELIQEIKLNNINWSPGMKVALFNFYTKNEMFAEALIELYETQTMFPDFQIDNFKIILFVTLLVKNNKVNEALQVIKECTNVNHKTKSLSQCLTLLNLLAKYSDYSCVKQMVDLLVKNGYCEYNDVILTILLRKSVLENSIEFTVDEFKNCVETYNKTPAIHEILTQIINQTSNSSSNQLLEDVYHLIVNVHGKEIATVNIAMALAQCNRKEELQDLLQSNSLSDKALFKECKYLQENDIIKICWRMLKIGGEILKTNLEPVCNLTLVIYIKRGEFKSAEMLRKEMVQKGVRPSSEFEAAFNNFMMKHTVPYSTNRVVQ